MGKELTFLERKCETAERYAHEELMAEIRAEAERDKLLIRGRFILLNIALLCGSVLAGLLIVHAA
jgi:hypothetical protein